MRHQHNPHWHLMWIVCLGLLLRLAFVGYTQPVSACAPISPRLIGWSPGDPHSNDIRDQDEGVLLNGSFELPVVASNGFRRGTPASWQWSGPVGLIGNGNTGEGWPLPQHGQQYVDIGNESIYALSQSFAIDTVGTYLLRWQESAAAAPPGYQTSPYSVSILNATQHEVATWNFDAYHGGTWFARSNLVSLQPGTFTLRFRAEGVANGTDTLIDNVSLEAFDLEPMTEVGGTIVNQLWTSNNSPYRVVGDILVANLTIRPGVKVFFAGNYVFEIAGKLNAIGTHEAPIVFTAPSTGWQGLFFNSSLPGSELAHCVVERAVNSGIRIASSTPVISDCVIRSNTITMQDQGDVVSVAVDGGAGIKTDSSLVLDNCKILHNSVIVDVRANDATATARGAGIYSTAPLTLINCTVFSNSLVAHAWGGGTSSGSSFCEGGGIWAGTNLTLQGCLIRANSANADSIPNGGQSSASSLGGGVFCKGPLSQRNCIISGNSATGVVDVAFFGGDFDLKGGGVYNAGNPSTIENCTLAFNHPDGLATSWGTTTVQNSIFWNNLTNQVVGTTNVTYSDVQGGFPGVGNTNRNPIFLSTTELIIVPGSPCINAGSTNVAFKDVYFPPSLGTARNDMGAHGGPGAGARLRARFGLQFEVTLLGGVPGYNYVIQASTNLIDWLTFQQLRITHLGESAHFLEPAMNGIPHRFYRLDVIP